MLQEKWSRRRPRDREVGYNDGMRAPPVGGMTDPNDAQASNNLGTELAGREKMEDAVARYRQEMDPSLTGGEPRWS